MSLSGVDCRHWPHSLLSSKCSSSPLTLTPVRNMEWSSESHWKAYKKKYKNLQKWDQGTAFTCHSSGPASPARWGNRMFITATSCPSGNCSPHAAPAPGTHHSHPTLALFQGLVWEREEGTQLQKLRNSTKRRNQLPAQHKSPVPNIIKNAASQQRLCSTIGQCCNKAGRLWDHEKYLIIMKIKT